MNYKIIADEVRLKEFIEWLPDLKNDETFYCCLFARKKYSVNSSRIKGDKQQLKSFTSDKSRMANKIKQLEGAVGCYTMGDDPVPEDSLAMYVQVNPRSLIKAAKQTLIELAKRITEPYNGYNPKSISMSAIQNSPSRKVYSEFDFDEANPDDLMDTIRGKINEDCLTFVKTRGGFHLLVEHSKIKPEYEKTWYNLIARSKGVDVRGDMLLPMPGCFQGTFEPHFYDFRKDEKIQGEHQSSGIL